MEFWNNPVEFARVLGLLVPLAVAMLTRVNATPAVKSVVNIILSALAGVTAFLVGADGGWNWPGFFNAWFNAFVVGIVAYYGAYKPIGVAPKVAGATGSFGIGGGTTRNQGGYVRVPHWVWVLVFAVLLLIVIIAVV